MTLTFDERRLRYIIKEELADGLVDVKKDIAELKIITAKTADHVERLSNDVHDCLIMLHDHKKAIRRLEDTVDIPHFRETPL